MVNQSKVNDQKYWRKWEAAGAVGTIETAMTRESVKKEVKSEDHTLEDRAFDTIRISMAPVIEKLRNLRDYMPNEDDIVYEFAAYLATRLNSHLVPQGFIIGAEQALYDLNKGVNGVTGEPIQNGAVGYPPMMYSLLRTQVLDIADAVCPKDFAQGARAFYEQVGRKMEEKSKAAL